MRKPFSTRRARAHRRSRRGALVETLETRCLLAGDPVITELMASNQSVLADEDGDFSDWLEIHNRGDEVVDLDGWYLTDDADDLERWRFPSVPLPPGEALVVFASGKDRTAPSGPLHTDFGLGAEGEYLALVRPDGITIADRFDPAFPTQFSDVSYGSGMTVSSSTLVAEGAVAEVLIPASGALGTEWTEADYTSDANDWITETSPGTPVTTGIGFDNETGFPSLVGHWPLDEPAGTGGAGSVADASESGHDGTPAGSMSFGADGASEFTDRGVDFTNGSINVPYSAALNPASFTFTAWVYPHSTTDFQSVVTSRLDTFPNLYGFVLYNDSGGQWAFWTGAGANAGGWGVLSGPAVVTNAWSHLAISFDAATGTKTLWIDGELAATSSDQGYAATTGRELHIGGGGDFGTQYPFDGVIDDAGLFNEALDQAAIRNVMNSGVPDSAASNYGSLIDADLTGAMAGINASAYMRIPFQVEDPTAWGQLWLNMRYDDGFVAYLNGQRVAARNAPENPAWDSTASQPRPDSLAVQFEPIDVTSFLTALRPGLNVLAVHGLNVAADDPDFLLSPELVGISGVSVSDARGYFLEPTPGELNSTAVMIGPRISAVSHSPDVPDVNESLTVTASVDPRLGQVAEVVLHYRSMYDAEGTVAMRDDGAGPDVAAGDGIYGATIPGGLAAAGRMIRYYVTADDDQGNSTREPANLDRVGTKQSPEYFGTVVSDPSDSTTLPRFAWFSADVSAAHMRAGTRGSVFYGGEFHDNVFVRQRGGFTNAAVSQKFVFNRQHELLLNDKVGRVQEININGPGSDASYLRQPLAYTAHQVAGGASSESFLAYMSVNGIRDRIGIVIEQVDEDFLERNGYDPEGDLYKFVQRSNLNPVFSDITTGVEKKTGDTSDFSSIAALVAAMDGSPQQKQVFVRDYVDLPQFINYLAVRTVQQQADDVRKNFYMYQDTRGDQLWRIFPWDLDWTFEIVGGHGPERTEHPFFGVQAFPTDDGNNQWNKLYDGLLASRGIQEMYLRRARTLMDQFYGGPPGSPGTTWFADGVNTLFPQIESFVGGAAAGARTSLLGSIENRRRDLYNELTFSIAGTSEVIPPSQQGNPPVTFTTFEFAPASGNQDEEYIELFNGNAVAVDLSGWELRGGVDFVFPPGSVMGAGTSLYVSPDVAAFRERTSQPRGGRGLFYQGPYSGHLSNFGETVTLVAADGEVIDTLTYEGNPSETQQYLRVTEINYNPAEPTDTELGAIPSLDNNDFEFIELTNVGPATLELEGTRFSRGVQYAFPSFSLPAGESVLVVRDLDAFDLRYGAGLNVVGPFESGSLDNGGETIKLEDSLNGTIHEFRYEDDSPWPERADGTGSTLQVIDTEGDYGDAANWRASVEYGGSPGSGVLSPVVVDVLVNEVLSHTDPPTLDSIELINTGSSPVDVSGWYLSDSSGNLSKFRIPDDTVLSPSEYVVFDEDDFNATSGTSPNDFSLNGAHGDDVWLMAADATGKLTRFVDHVEFGAQANGESWGRWPDGNGQLYPMRVATLGSPNDGPRVGPLVIGEIAYHVADPDGPDGIDPDDLEFFEIWNPTASAVDLTNWRVDGGVEYAFPDDLLIAPGDALVVVPFDPTDDANSQRLEDFRAHYGIDASVPLTGGYSRRLGNEGDTVRLLRPDEPPVDEPEFVPMLLEDEVIYDDRSPWPFGPDGDGGTLSRIDVSGWGNDPRSWGSESPRPGVIESSPLRVVSVTINQSVQDPEPRPSGPAPADGRTQRSTLHDVVVTFNRSTEVSVGDLTLTSLGVNAPVDPDLVVTLESALITQEVNRLMIDLSQVQLPEGAYSLTIDGGITDVTGRALDGDGDGVTGDSFVRTGSAANGLYRLTADWNGDGGISIFDFGTFAYWFGLSVPAAPAYVDLNDDSGVSIFDFTLFSQRFGGSVKFPPALARPSVAASAAPSIAAAGDVGETRITTDRVTDEIRAFEKAPVRWTTEDRRRAADRPLDRRDSYLVESLDQEWEGLLDVIGRDVLRGWSAGMA